MASAEAEAVFAAMATCWNCGSSALRPISDAVMRKYLWRAEEDCGSLFRDFLVQQHIRECDNCGKAVIVGSNLSPFKTWCLCEQS